MLSNLENYRLWWGTGLGDEVVEIYGIFKMKNCSITSLF
jgi:hypothetical protein